MKEKKGVEILVVCLYVNDLLFIGNDQTMFVKFRKSMMAEFSMFNLGKMHLFLGIF